MDDGCGVYGIHHFHTHIQKLGKSIHISRNLIFTFCDSGTPPKIVPKEKTYPFCPKTLLPSKSSWLSWEEASTSHPSEQLKTAKLTYVPTATTAHQNHQLSSIILSSNHPIQAHRTGRFPAPLEVLRHEVVDLQGASDAAHRQRGAQGVGGHQMGRRAAHLALHVLLVPCVHQVAIELQPKFFGTCWRGKPGWFWGKPNWRCSDLFHGDSGWFPWKTSGSWWKSVEKQWFIAWDVTQ